MRAKPGLVPDCDVHGEPMFRDECDARSLGLPGDRDIIMWRCARPGCGRVFEGAIGYVDCPPHACSPTPQCAREGAFLVAQWAIGRYLCPVAGCTTEQAWNRSDAFQPKQEE